MLRKDAKIELMRQVPLFSGCSKRELGDIAALADELRFEPGRTLIQEGKRGREFIVVIDGTVEVTKGGKKLRARGDDTFFGELALLTDAPRSATVTTTSPVRALIISDTAFQRLLKASPQIPLKMLKTVVERLSPEIQRPVFPSGRTGIPLDNEERGNTVHQTIRDAMTSNPRTVETNSSVQEAAKLMRSEDVGSIPIVEGDRLVAIVTDRDIALRVVGEGKSLDTTVGDIASRDLVTIDPQQSLDEAARLMGEHQLRRLPVVEEDGKLVGIVAQADVAQSGHDQLTGDVVQKISQ